MPIAAIASNSSTIIEEVLDQLEIAISPTPLTLTQKLVLRQVLDGKTYTQIAEQNGYSNDYIKSVGSELWQILSKALGESITKRNFCGVIQRHLAKGKNHPIQENLVVPKPKTQDWGEAIDTSFFFGRVEELAILRNWMLRDKCRLISILGMGGAGKTALSVRCAEQNQEEFTYLIWRSLRNPPPINELLTDLLQFLSQGQETNLPNDINSRISCLMKYLRQHRCLLVLDNYDSILCRGNELETYDSSNPSLSVGRYRRGYEEYRQLLHRIGEERHQSCILLTSREKPLGLASKEGENFPIRSLKLNGLGIPAAQSIFKAAGVSISESASQQLVHRYSGNPLALKMAATMIREIFDRDVAAFLKQNTLIFGEIADLLDEQYDRLSNLERQVIKRLAAYYQGVSLEQLQKDLHKSLSSQQLMTALNALQQRSLIETYAFQFRLKSLIANYITQVSGK